MSEQIIETIVGPLVVRDTGRDGTLPTAVLWHSLFVDSRSWARVEPSLARERRLVLVTGPGHGASGDPGRRYTMAECAEAARQVLGRLGIEGAVDWIGNAWGGHVGILLAAQHPDLVRTLVTAGTPVRAYTWKGRQRTRLLLALYRVLGPARFLVDILSQVLLSPRTAASDPDAVAMVGEEFRAADRRAMANAIVSISLRRRDLTPVLSAIHAPTLFLTGSEHSDWTGEQARAAAATLAAGSAAVIDGAAYLLPLERPDEFVRAVAEFWIQASRSSDGQSARKGRRPSST
ncbi:alpha/beta hydrolase [Nocardia sp. NPDC050718]|uniref:alpha/beta fold hydrolase n=1 Tax=Nocardia sp. NPDC050718 TaxID=3155788 RepID=UPI0033F6F775